RHRQVALIDFAARDGHARLQAHAHTNGRRFAPRLGLQGVLRLERRGHCVGGYGEGDAESITDGLKDVSLMAFDGVAQEGVVTLEGCWQGGAILLRQLRAAFDIGEQEGDSARWERGYREPPCCDIPKLLCYSISMRDMI